MKIVALTDIHGEYAKAEAIITKEFPDIVIIGGDLTTVGSVKEAETAIQQFRSLCPTVCCVAGNMDLPAHDDLFIQLGVSINGRGMIVGDIGFFGVSAAQHSPLHTPYEVTEEELSARIHKGYRDVQHSKRKIFVPHAPPYGTKVDLIHSGIHVGSMAVREFIEDHQPDVTICGHIHEARGQDIIEKTKIVNCGAAKNGYYARVVAGSEFKITMHQFFK